MTRKAQNRMARYKKEMEEGRVIPKIVDLGPQPRRFGKEKAMYEYMNEYFRDATNFAKWYFIGPNGITRHNNAIDVKATPVVPDQLQLEVVDTTKEETC